MRLRPTRLRSRSLRRLADNRQVAVGVDAERRVELRHALRQPRRDASHVAVREMVGEFVQHHGQRLAVLPAPGRHQVVAVRPRREVPGHPLHAPAVRAARLEAGEGAEVLQRDDVGRHRRGQPQRRRHLLEDGEERFELDGQLRQVLRRRGADDGELSGRQALPLAAERDLRGRRRRRRPTAGARARHRRAAAAGPHSAASEDDGQARGGAGWAWRDSRVTAWRAPTSYTNAAGQNANETATPFARGVMTGAIERRACDGPAEPGARYTTVFFPASGRR